MGERWTRHAGKVVSADLFVKVHMEKITGAMLLSDPDLLPRDVAILLALIGEMDPNTGRVNSSISALARKCSLKQANVSLSLSRLKKKMLVVPRRDKNSGAYYMLINPDLASVGGVKTRAIAYKQFLGEWVEALEEEADGDLGRVRKAMEALFKVKTDDQIKRDTRIKNEEEELARLMREADPRLQEILSSRKLFRPMTEYGRWQHGI